MKKSPARQQLFTKKKLYTGRTTYVSTPLTNLLRQKKGSTCLYETNDHDATNRVVHSIATRCHGEAWIESLFAIDLKNDRKYNLCRVIVIRPARAVKQLRPSTVNFCAPPPVLARCVAKTSCIYENMKSVTGAGNISGARLSITTLHLVDILRGTTHPITRAEVVEQGRPFERMRPELEIYQAFLDSKNFRWE